MCHTWAPDSFQGGGGLPFQAEAGTITFILITDQIVDHWSKIDLRSYQDHMAVKLSKIRSDLFI
jgi:hypothetical protein